MLASTVVLWFSLQKLKTIDQASKSAGPFSKIWDALTTIT
jgi:hypothetical protein